MEKIQFDDIAALQKHVSEEFGEFGDEVEISFNLKGRKWTDPQGSIKYFNTLQAWRLDKKATTTGADQNTGAQPPMEEPEWLADKGEGENDLPF